MHLAPAKPGKGEQVIDELAHAYGVLAHDSQHAQALLIKLVAIGQHDLAGEAIHGAQGRPQVMGDGVGEGLKLLIGGLELGGALRDAFF